MGVSDSGESMKKSVAAVMGTILSLSLLGSGAAGAAVPPDTRAALDRRAVSPSFSWESFRLAPTAVGGLPTDAAITFDLNDRPSVAMVVNQGIDQGAALMVTSIVNGNWSPPIVLGPALPGTVISSSTSPHEPAFAWRQDRDTLSLARLSDGRWESTSAPLPPRWVQDPYALPQPVRLSHLTYMIFVGHINRAFESPAMAVIWPEQSSLATWFEFTPPDEVEALSGSDSGSVFSLWIDNTGLLKIADFAATATGPLRGAMVMRQWDGLKAAWSTPSVIREGEVSPFFSHAVQREDGIVLLVSARDTTYGQVPQVEVIQQIGESWAEPLVIPRASLSLLPPDVLNGPICVGTDQGTWLLNDYGALQRMGKATRAGRSLNGRRHDDAAAFYRHDLGACVLASGFWATILGHGYSSNLPAVRPANIEADWSSSGSATGSVSVVNDAIRYTSLSARMPAQPNAVSNLRVASRQKGSVVIAWDAPSPLPYPTARYQVRLLRAGKPAAWSKLSPALSRTIRISRTGVRFTVQVRAVNEVGASPSVALPLVS